ncbi:hypothetical protein [Streptomyces sp. NPDC005374]|uniref:hypothetical protein n=1 Tax=Streptomyces sp. NPDC005374 TaxID=3364713 RepID=UPI003683A330
MNGVHLPAGSGAQARLQALLLHPDRLEDFLACLVRLTATTLPVDTLYCSIALTPQDCPTPAGPPATDVMDERTLGRSQQHALSFAADLRGTGRSGSQRPDVPPAP